MSVEKVEKRGQNRPRTRNVGSAIPEPPKGQIKGPIINGPRTYVVCPICQMGVPTQMRKKHLKGHQA